MAQLVCPACRTKLPEGGATRCPGCGAKLAVRKPAPIESKRVEPAEPESPPEPEEEARPKKRKKKKAKKAGVFQEHKVAFLVGGGVLATVVVVGGVLLALSGGGVPGGGPVGPGLLPGLPTAGGQYAVVDSLPALPPGPAELPEEPAPPLDTEYVPIPPKVVKAKAVWSVKPDPPVEDEKPLASVVGAITPEPSLLLASFGGPYAVGIPPDPDRAKRAKAIKGPDGRLSQLVSIDKDPHPLLDVRTGKHVGKFPTEARIRSSCRLSPDGKYLACSAFEGQKGKITRDELVVWERDADQPACRWPLPGPVLWTDFIAPDRLALYHTTPSPTFVVLDVAKGAPVVTAPLPADEFSHEHDHLSSRRDFSAWRVQTTSGAVSPGRKLIALGGRTSVVLLEADGKVVARFPVELVGVARGYLGMSFNKDGTELRTLTQQGGAWLLRVWSLADGTTLHKTPFPFAPRPGWDPHLDNVPGLAILSGIEPNTLIVGYQVFDVAAGQMVAELPYQAQRWADPTRLLALGTVDQAQSVKALAAAADFIPRGKSLIVANLDRETLAANAPKSRPPVVANATGNTVARPATVAADRSKATTVRLKPPAEWSLKPGAAAPRPKGPMHVWPHAFAATEAAVVTESLSWVRYDLNSGKTIGTPIGLWAAPGDSSQNERIPNHSAALTRDGKQLALVDPLDRARVDVWDASGKRLIGLRPYEDDGIIWLSWSADGKLLTADNGGRLTAWDVATGEAAFEVQGKFASLLTAPGAEWVLITTPARHLFFVDASTGRCLGHLPASPSFRESTLSPDAKALLRLGRWQVKVWDLQTGKRKDDRETLLVPITLAISDQPHKELPGMRDPALGVFWLGPRRVLSHSQSPGEQQSRYYLYDLDAHTHTYRYAAKLGTFRNDPLGRPWMSTRAPGEIWTAPDVPGLEPFKQDLAFSPGVTIRVEVDVGARAVSQVAAQKMASELQARGFKIGRDGWVLRTDHKVNTVSTDLRDPNTNERLSVASLDLTWRLLDPEGKEAWKGSNNNRFDPFNSKYVVVGSRKVDLAPGGLGGGSSSIRLDYGGRNPKDAQVEEMLDRAMFSGHAIPFYMPTYMVRNEGGYSALPLEAPPSGKQKP